MINIISRVSMVAVGIPVAAMVILMAVFSGFDDLIRRMYRDFDPDFIITPAEGKAFDVRTLDAAAIGAIDGVAATSLVLEGSAMLEYGGRQRIATVRGVDSLFARVVPLERMMYGGGNTYGGGNAHGGFSLGSGGAIVGQGIAYEMGIRVGLSEQLGFYAPRRGAISALLPQAGVSAIRLPVEGVFVLDADTDGEYVIVPIESARQLLDYGGMASGLAIRTHAGASEKRLREAMATVAGDDFRILSRLEQKESMYRIMRMEKWGIFFIGFAVLIIASFSIVGSLVMLILDKRDGIRTLASLGATTGFIRGVFVRQGVMIGTIGAGAGLVLGLSVCAVQQWFGVIPMPGASFLVDSYPVLVRGADVAAICIAFLIVIYLISIFTVKITVRK
ncbi:MAG: ABC transporter permease [Alistipes sp.]|nr:ABC transporter permease [Alistipes sp.]